MRLFGGLCWMWCMLLWQQHVVGAAEDDKKIRGIAIVTGGTRGIGRGIAQQLVSSSNVGIDVLVLTYNTDKTTAERVAQEIQEQFPQVAVELIGGDISLEATRDKLFEMLDRKYLTNIKDNDNDKTQYHLNVMVHNAGQYLGVTSDNANGLNQEGKSSMAFQYGDGSILMNGNGNDGNCKNNDNAATVDWEHVRYYQQLYGEAWIDLCERSLVRMRQHFQGGNFCGGSLIGISSPGATCLDRPIPGYSLPGTGKAVMEFTSRIYAIQAANIGVRCNVIVPGVVHTQGWDRSILSGKEQSTQESDKEAIDKVMESLTSRIPLMGQLMSPQDIGDVVAFLSSPRGGGRFITGQRIVADAGWTLRMK